MRKITPWVLVLALISAGPVLAAANDPSQHEIYQAAQAGHLAQAEQMVTQVLQDHPKSAKAHYVAAEVYARAGDFSTARRELAAAESLEPGLPFAPRQSVAALRAELSQGRFLPGAGQGQPAGYYSVPYARPHRISWSLLLVILAGIVIVWSLVRRRMYAGRAYPSYPGQPMGGVGPMGPGGGVVPPYPYGGVPGSGPGLLGSLGTGLAVGAGVAAGEELVRHALGGGVQGGGLIPPANAGEVVEDPSQINPDMGGQDFGLPGDSSWDDGSGGGGDFGTGGDFGGGGGDDWT